MFNNIPYWPKILIIYLTSLIIYIFILSFKKEGLINMIKNFFEKLKHLIASIFKDVPSLLAFEAVIATVLYTILFFRSEKDKISYLSLAFAFVSFAFTLNDSNKASKETKELNKSIQRLNSLLQENKTINSIETQEVACKEDFDNKTKLNDKTKIILFIIFFIFIIPFIVNYIVDIPSPFGFINDSNKEIWIPFLGTIIGGSITLFGVWWTIDNQKKAKKNRFSNTIQTCFNSNSYKFNKNSCYYTRIR